MKGIGRLSLIVCAAMLLCVTAKPSDARPYCRDFDTYQDAVAYCLATYNNTFNCGGLDRDNDGRLCECNPGGPEADEQACISRREEDRK